MPPSPAAVTAPPSALPLPPVVESAEAPPLLVHKKEKFDTGLKNIHHEEVPRYKHLFKHRVNR